MNNLNKKKNQGFTLIELLVVVAIIAILALIVLLALNPAEMARRSRDSRKLSDLGTLRKAIDLALADGNKGSLDTFSDTLDPATTGILQHFPNGGTTGGLDISSYISAIPQDPANNGSTTDKVHVITNAGCTADPVSWSEDFRNNMVYTYWSDGNVYVLRGRLESTENCNAIAGDGNDNDYYDIGTDPNLDETP